MWGLPEINDDLGEPRESWYTQRPWIWRRAFAAAGRQPPRWTRYQNKDAPTTISIASPSQPPTAPSPAWTPSSQASGGVVSQDVAIPTTAA